MRVDIDNAANT